MPRRVLLLLAVFAAHCGAADLMLLETTPAWDGLMRAGASSEIGLRLVAAGASELAVTLTTPTTRVEYTATLEPNVPLLLTMPVPPTPADRVRIEAQLNGLSRVQQEVHLKSLPTDQPVVAVIGEISGAWHTGRTLSIIHPGTATLPRHSWSYAVIDLLVMDTTSLRHLSAPQAEALQEYLATCGKFIGYRMPHAVIEVLRENAGCNSRLVKTADNLQQLEEHADALLEDSRPALPSVPDLRSLLPDEDRQQWIMPLVTFFAGYFLVLLVAAHYRGGSAYLPAIPVLASLLGLYAWSSGAVETRLVNWAVMESGSNTARYSALLVARARGQGETEIILPARLGMPDPVQPHALMLIRQLHGTAGLQLGFPTRLFSRHEFVLQGSITPNIQLVLGVAATGPVIDNHGHVQSPPSLLAWHGNKYSVPSLSPGERWVTPAKPGSWGNDGAERILREQAVRETAALLIPYSLADAGIIAADTDTHGYLLVHL
jgi:hypothetical protein